MMVRLQVTLAGFWHLSVVYVCSEIAVTHKHVLKFSTCRSTKAFVYYLAERGPEQLKTSLQLENMNGGLTTKF